MAENADGSEKSEAPTPSRRNKARDEGQVAKSQDLTAAAMLLGFFLMLSWTGSGVVEALRQILEQTLQADILIDLSADHAFEWLRDLAFMVMRAMAPLMLGAIFIAIVVNAYQVGFRLSGKSVQPKFAAINPVKGFGKIFGKGQGPVKMLMNISKMVLVGLVAYSAIHGRIEQVLAASTLEFGAIFTLTATMVYDVGVRVALALLILAVLDWSYQKWKHEQDLKMTVQEVKDEMRNMDGDPKVKQRRREIQMQQAMRRVRSEVPKADVIVTNPTHFSVAIAYDEGSMHAPKVVAKGGDHMAFRIREIAIQHGIPIVERPPLARNLYANVEVGQHIPEDLYNAVAEILAYVMEVSK